MKRHYLYKITKEGVKLYYKWGEWDLSPVMASLHTLAEAKALAKKLDGVVIDTIPAAKEFKEKEFFIPSFREVIWNGKNGHSPEFPSHLLHKIPESMQSLAKQAYQISLQLLQIENQYSLLWLREKQKSVELSRDEMNDLREKEHNAKIQREKKKKAHSLRGYDRRIYKKTGLLPEEFLDKLVGDFETFLQKKRETQNG